MTLRLGSPPVMVVVVVTRPSIFLTGSCSVVLDWTSTTSSSVVVVVVPSAVYPGELLARLKPFPDIGLLRLTKTTAANESRPDGVIQEAQFLSGTEGTILGQNRVVG